MVLRVYCLLCVCVCLTVIGNGFKGLLFIVCLLCMCVCVCVCVWLLSATVLRVYCLCAVCIWLLLVMVFEGLLFVVCACDCYWFFIWGFIVCLLCVCLIVIGNGFKGLFIICLPFVRPVWNIRCLCNGRWPFHENNFSSGFSWGAVYSRPFKVCTPLTSVKLHRQSVSVTLTQAQGHGTRVS